MVASRETFQDVYDHILRGLKVSTESMGGYTTADIAAGMNFCQHKLALKLAEHGDDLIGTSTSISMVSSQEVYSLGKGGDIDIENFLLPLKQVLLVEDSTHEYPQIRIKASERWRYLALVQNSTDGYYYFTTKASTSETDTMLPAIGVLPMPSMAGYDLKVWFFFKPRPVTQADGRLTNGSQIPDLPENVIPYFKTICVRFLLEQGGKKESIDLLMPRLAEERADAMNAMGTQIENDPILMEHWEDPAADY